MDCISLETKSLILNFSTENGALIGLFSKKTGWVINKRENLGESWCLLVPISEDKRNNRVLGEKQKLSYYTADENGVTLVWNGVVSERADKLDIKVTAKITREGDGARYTLTIDNNSDYMVETAYSPRIADLNKPENEEWFKTFLWFYGTAEEWNIYPKFDNHKGDHGILYPTQISNGYNSSPCSPFILLRGEREGLYVGVEDDGALVSFQNELIPGYDSAIDDRVPKISEINGKPVHVVFSVIHQCYIPSGEKRELSSIYLEAYKGGWQEGVDVYKNKRGEKCNKIAPVPKWAREPHSWYQVHLNSPEGEVRYRYSDLPALFKECKDNGITAIQIVGWNDGGQDGNNPSHDTDDRLGTFAEFKEAIKEGKELGVKIILFTKFTWAEQSTERFKKELFKYAIKNPYGDYYVYPGYQYFTAAQLLDINTKRLIPMCFGSDKWLDVCVEELKKVLFLEPDGILYDECQHHGGTLACFDVSHGHEYGFPVYKNDLKLIKKFREKYNLKSEFMIAGESCYDAEFTEYGLAYFRSRKIGHVALSRYMRPDALIMTAVSGFNDRNMINQCLMNKYVISYEPFYFKGRLKDFPDTVKYGVKMDELRRELKEYLWDGEYRDKCGATVLNGEEHFNTFSRFVSEKGKSLLVICNYGDSEITVTAKVEGEKLKKYRTVEDSLWKEVKDGIIIPPQSAVVVR